MFVTSAAYFELILPPLKNNYCSDRTTLFLFFPKPLSWLADIGEFLPSLDGFCRFRLYLVLKIGESEQRTVRAFSLCVCSAAGFGHRSAALLRFRSVPPLDYLLQSTVQSPVWWVCCSPWTWVAVNLSCPDILKLKSENRFETEFIHEVFW